MLRHILALLFFISCSKDYQITSSKNLTKFKCPNFENCYTSMDTGKSYILPFKMLGEDGKQNIKNIEKLITGLKENYTTFSNDFYLKARKENFQLEFIADQTNRVIHIRFQTSSLGFFNGNNGKKVIEKIRFKFFQNDY